MGVVAGLLVLAAGCLGQIATPKPTLREERTITAVVSSGLVPANRTAQEFYMVLIEGEEHAKRRAGTGADRGSVCDPVWSFDLDRSAKTLRYDGRRYPLDPKALQVLVATKYRAPTISGGIGQDCATKASLSGFGGRASFHGRLRADMSIDLVVEPQNGFVTYNASYFVPMGKKIHVNFTRIVESQAIKYEVTGDYEVTNLGPWNRTALEAAPTRR